MAISALPSLMPTLAAPASRSTFVSAFVPPNGSVSAPDLFTRALQTSVATGAPLPGVESAAAAGRVDAVRVLESSYFRDLVAGFGQGIGATNPLAITPAFLGDLGLEAALGRNGLPGALQGLNDRDAASLLSSAMSLFDTIQALGGDDESGPEIGALLDITV
jgi:hypothetical protein